jgi:hypothetical protein
MPYPGPMNWFPPHHHRDQARNPNQLKRVQKRTQNFKSGEVQRKKEARVLPDVLSVPNQDSIRLEETITDKNSSVQPFIRSTTPNLMQPIPNFLEVIAKMTKESTIQKDELEREASATGKPFPRICVDRGVLQSEASLDDIVLPSTNVDLCPSTLFVTRRFAENIRCVSLKDMNPCFGVKEPKLYANPSPLSFGGLKTSQIEKIAKVTHYVFKKQRSKSKATEQDDLARKTENLKISSDHSETITMSVSPTPSTSSVETVLLVLPQRESNTSETSMTFHVSSLPPSELIDDETMEINDLSEFDALSFVPIFRRCYQAFGSWIILK